MLKMNINHPENIGQDLPFSWMLCGCCFDSVPCWICKLVSVLSIAKRPCSDNLMMNLHEWEQYNNAESWMQVWSKTHLSKSCTKITMMYKEFSHNTTHHCTQDYIFLWCVKILWNLHFCYYLLIVCDILGNRVVSVSSNLGCVHCSLELWNTD